jgi:SAM-dependent methyltransferase
MANQQIDELAFRSFERARHDALAGSYHDFFAPITALAIEPLLDAAHVAPGSRLLDFACGSGVLAGAAARRGMAAFGVDLAPSMIALARTLNPSVDFREGDVEALPFNEASFDAVACNFGLGHFPNAERAMTECMRVLRPEGYLAVSWWDVPSRQRIQGLFVDALQQVGAAPPPELPAGPPIFSYSEDGELRRLLEQAGLLSVAIKQYSSTYRVDSIETLWAGSMGSLVRTSAVVLAQTPETQKRIRAAYGHLASAYADNKELAIPISFKVAAGRARAEQRGG